MIAVVNATWVGPGGVVASGTLAGAAGRLELYPGSTPELPPATTVLDGTGFLVFPGCTDAHVHFREPGQSAKEGIANGSRAALAGGVTTVLDMPNNRPPCSTPARLEHKRALFQRKSAVNWGLFVQASPDTAQWTVESLRTGSQEPNLREFDLRVPGRRGGSGLSRFERNGTGRTGFVGAKIYLARSSVLPALRDPTVLRRIFETFSLVAVHAEDEREFRTGTDLPHHVARPAGSIASALSLVEGTLRSLAPGLRPRVVICHASSTEEIRWLVRMKDDGFDVWGETCPQYLWLMQDDYLLYGAGLKVNPPLRTTADAMALRHALRDGVLDFLSTDHAPHLPSEKGGSAPPSGMPGVEWYLPNAWRLVDDEGIGMERLLDVTCVAAARCYGLSGRDGLRPGNHADFVLVRTGRVAPHPRLPITKAGYCPYSSSIGDCAWGLEVAATVVGGVLRFHEGRFLPGPPGQEVSTW